MLRWEENILVYFSLVAPQGYLYIGTFHGGREINKYEANTHRQESQLHATIKDDEEEEDSIKVV